MGGDESRSATAQIDKPRGADIQARSGVSRQWTIDDIAGAVRRLLRDDDLILLALSAQSVGQSRPLGHGEAKAQEKRRFAPACRMRRVQQVMRDFPFWHDGQMGVGEFHLPASSTSLISAWVKAMAGETTIRAA
jgi:hypothetical protein